jgi:THO complex subunit 2
MAAPSATNVSEPAASTPAPIIYKQHNFYDHISGDVISTWSKGGSQTVVTAAAEADDLILSEILQELTESCLHGRLTGSQAGEAIKDIIVARQAVDDVDVASHFIDTISLLDEEYQKHATLRSLVAATSIDPQIFRQELDISLLQALSLVRDTFEKMRTRKTTNVLYKQANFNLLREESEGYAKLVTDYFNTVQDACSRRDDNPNIAEDAFQRVKALVGAFDLDVGRVLDITLDVSANLLVKAFPFLIKFYRASSWWPDADTYDYIQSEDQGFSAIPDWALPGSGRVTSSEEEDARLASLRTKRDVKFWRSVAEKGMDAFFELGSRHIVNFEAVLSTLEQEIPVELDSRGKESNPEKRKYLSEQRRHMRETRTLPPQGNYDAAQLLGFKLRFYASAARNATDILPDNLMKLAAFLIKIGFISLRDLYPHLHPADEHMPAERTRLEKEKAARDAKDRPSAGVNALAMAAALTDDTAAPQRSTRADKERAGGATPAQEKKEETVEELPTPDNQKLQLLKALLLIGALPEALHIIGRFPWLLEVEPSLTPLLHRIANYMLSKMAKDARPLVNVNDLTQARDQVADGAVQPNGRLSFNARQPMRPMRWLHNDLHNPDDGIAYVHYYADWNDNIPTCQTLDDVFLLCNTFLGLLGLKVGQDVKLYGTLLRLAKVSLTQDQSAANRARWLEMMRRLLVPALSLSKHNPHLSQEVFELLAFYPTATRYAIYAEWFTGRTSRLPDMRSAFDRNKAEVRLVLRRVSNDTGKKQSRALAKVTLSSPGIVVMEMINQLESYSNMIPSLVECTRFFSPLAYDVLTWCLINSMGGQGRDRQQADGMLTSPWLQALSHFVASLYTKYSNLDPTPVLQYLAFELRSGNATDLEMIEQILVEMAGIRSDVEFNDAQVLAMAGGEQLQSHIMRQLSDTRHIKDKSAKRLIKALAEPKLVGQILVAIAQERQMYAHHAGSSDMPLKVLGNNLDKIHAIFAQYLEVLKTNLKPDLFESSIPEAARLVGEFGIEPGIALTICRTAIRHRMSEADAAKRKAEVEEKKLKAAQAKAESNGDVAMQGAEEAPTQGKVELKAEASVDDSEENSSIQSPWHPVLLPVIERLTKAAPNLAERISIPFYVSFWTLAHPDLFVPTDSYKREIARIDSQMNEITGNRSDMSAVALKERDRKKRALQEVRDRLSNETKPHLNAYLQVRSRISGNHGENQHWFPKIVAKNAREEHAAKDARHLGLLEECFLPRAMLSSIDAQYAYHMLKMMHDNGTAGFSLMHLLSQLFKKQLLASLMFQYTATEAQNFGRFICETMKLLHRWHGDKDKYEKEALGTRKKLPGFVKTFDEKGEPKSVMDWEEFRRLLFNFHTFLYGALTACFESDEYMHVRNAIIVLKSVHVVFPMLSFQGKNMIEVVKKFSDKDSRQDLKLAAMSLLGPLKSGEKNWLTPQKFRLNDPGKDGAKAGGRTSSAQPESDAQKLNASASEFKPGSGVRVIGNARKESVTGGKEDGEIEDEKKSNDIRTKSAATIEKLATAVIHEDAKGAGRPDNSKAARDVIRPESDLTAAGTQGNGRPLPQHNGPRNDSKLPSTIPPRPPANNTSSRNDRDLPAKPASRFPSRGDEGYGRLDRPNDIRPQSRDQSPASRNSRPRSPSHAGRSSLRDDRSYDRPAAETRPNRDDVNHSRRDAENKTTSETRDRADTGSRNADRPVPVERSNRIPSSVILPDADTSRPASSSSGPGQGSMDVHVNPARLALINADAGSPANARRNPEKEQRRERDRDSRHDDRSSAAHSQPRADSRASSNRPLELMPNQATPHEANNDNTPTGPKRGRSNRESRESRDHGVSQESSYGRLNGPPAQDSAPSGPRQTGSTNDRGGRNADSNHRNGPAPASFNRGDDSSAPQRGGLSRQPSTSHFDRPSAPNSVPSTPAPEPAIPVHPSRLAQLNQPSPLQTNFTAPNGPRGNASPTTGAPSGPRSTPRVGPVSTMPSPASANPPSGPASRRADRTTRGPQPASTPSGQGVNFRGASTRQASANSSTPVSGRPPMAAPDTPNESLGRHKVHESRRVIDEPPPNPSNSRPDLFQTKSSNNWQDSDGGNGGNGGSERRRDRGDDRQPPRSFKDDPPSFRHPNGPQSGPQPDNRDRHVQDGSPRPRRGLNGANEGADVSQRRQDLTTQLAPPQWERGPSRIQNSDDGRRNSGRLGGGGNNNGSGQAREDFRSSNNSGPGPLSTHVSVGDAAGPPFRNNDGDRGNQRGRGGRDDVFASMPQQGPFQGQGQGQGQGQQQGGQPQHHSENRKRGPLPPYEGPPGSGKRRRN